MKIESANAVAVSSPKEHDDVSIPKEKISTDKQSILIDPDVPAVSANKGQTKSTPDHVSDAVPDNGTPCRRQYNDDDADLTSGRGKERSCNEDSLSGERHAGTFECNNTKDDPRPVGWDQANQGIGQRGILHLRKEGLSPFFNCPLRQPRSRCCAVTLSSRSWRAR